MKKNGSSQRSLGRRANALNEQCREPFDLIAVPILALLNQGDPTNTPLLSRDRGVLFFSLQNKTPKGTRGGPFGRLSVFRP